MRNPASLPRLGGLPRFAQMAVLCLGMAMTPTAFASQPEGYVPRDQRNGALKYWESWALIPPDVSAKLGQIDWDAIGTNSDLSKMPSTFTSIVQEAPIDSIVNSLDNAASYPRCDFEVQWEDGPMTLLPHLAKLRSGTRVCRVANRVELSKGNTDRAAHITGLIFTQAHRAAQDPLLINSLVGIATAESGLYEVEAILAAGPLTVNAKKEIVAAIHVIETNDPLNTRACIAGERDTFLPWLERHCTDADLGTQLHNLAVNDFGMKAEEIGTDFKSMDQAAFRADVNKMKEAFEMLLQVWDQPDAPAKLKDMGAKISDGKYGRIAKHFFPSIENVKAAQDKLTKHMVEVRAALEKAPTK